MDATVDLVKIGIFKVTTLPMHYSWVTPDHATLLLSIAAAGEEGLSKAQARKVFPGKKGQGLLETVLLDVEVREVVEWLSDRRGKPSHLIPSWKGDELIQLLKAHARAGGSLDAATPPA